MIVASRTNIGRRLANEDSFLLLQEASSTYLLLAVADGMGGHAAGKRASTLAISGLEEQLEEALRGRFSDPVPKLRQAIRRVNLDIYRHAKEDPGCRGMGTTLTAALINGDEYIVANVGDSRLYHFDGWALSQVTHDHSLVAVLVAAGEITLAESYVHPQRNIITRALGTSEYEEADYFHRRSKAGDRLLLCSDGLHGPVTDAAMEDLLRKGEPIESQCDTLIDMALEQGATDNITVVMAFHTGEGTL